MFLLLTFRIPKQNKKGYYDYNRPTIVAFIELHAPKDERFENVLGIEIALILPVVYILWPLLHGAHAGSSSSSSRKNGDVVRSEDNSFSYLLGSIAWILWAVSLALMSAGLIIGAEFVSSDALLLSRFALKFENGYLVFSL